MKNSNNENNKNKEVVKTTGTAKKLVIKKTERQSALICHRV